MKGPYDVTWEMYFYIVATMLVWIPIIAWGTFKVLEWLERRRK